MTIFEFLEARLAEDEAIANAGAQSFSDTWTFNDGEEAARREEALKGGRFGANPRVDGITSGCRYNSESEMKHIARHDPARTLREVATKRAILVAALRLIRADVWWATSKAEDIACALAAIYSDHPDYQKGWALWAL